MTVLSFDITGEVELTSKLIYGEVAHSAFRVGGAYDKDVGWQPIHEFNTLSPDGGVAPEAVAASAEVALRGKLDFLVYGVAGPYVATGPYIGFDAECPGEEWTLSAGLRNDIGLSFRLPVIGQLADFSMTFAKTSTQIGSGPMPNPCDPGDRPWQGTLDVQQEVFGDQWVQESGSQHTWSEVAQATYSNLHRRVPSELDLDAVNQYSAVLEGSGTSSNMWQCGYTKSLTHTGRTYYEPSAYEARVGRTLRRRPSACKRRAGRHICVSSRSGPPRRASPTQRVVDSQPSSSTHQASSSTGGLGYPDWDQYAAQPLLDTDPDPDHLVGTTVWNMENPPFSGLREREMPDRYQVKISYDLRR